MTAPFRVTECYVRPIGQAAAITINVIGTAQGDVTHSSPINTGDPAKLAESFERAAAFLRSLQPAAPAAESTPDNAPEAA